MTVLLIVLLAVGLIALMERTHRRADRMDHAPGRVASVDERRLVAEVAAMRSSDEHLPTPTARVVEDLKLAHRHRMASFS